MLRWDTYQREHPPKRPNPQNSKGSLVSTETTEVDQDDVPMLGAFFDVDDDMTSDSPILIAEDPEPATVDQPTVTTGDPTASAVITGSTPPPPPTAAQVTAVLDAVHGASPAGAVSPTFGKAPTAPAPASPDTESVAEEPKPLPEWQKPLTSDELAILFGERALADSTPRLRLSGLNTKKGRYTIEKTEVTNTARDEQIQALQSNGKLPTNVRAIANYSARARINNELARVATKDRETSLILGVTESAQYGGASLSSLATTTIDSTDLFRYLWSNYTGVTFGAEEIELGPDGKPLIKLDGHDAPLIRPNGELYYPRKIRLEAAEAATLYDTQMVKQAYEARIPVLLYGPPGTGKTALCEAVLPGMYTISGTADTETADFVGSYTTDPSGAFEWIDGPLIKAMEDGVALFIDEVALIDSRVLALVYSVMDGRKEVHITANPRRGTVQAKEGFYVIGACNPDVPGAVMSDALLSRFSLQVEVTTDYDMLKTLGVSREIISVSKNLAKSQGSGAIQKAPQTRELLAFERIKAAMGIHVALANMVAAALPTDRDEYITALSSKFEGKITALRS